MNAEVRCQEGQERPVGMGVPRLSLLVWLLIPLVLAVPLFAHGCHMGDHDDEPALAPPFRDAERSR